MTSFYEQSDEIGSASAMFSFTSHTMGKQEERKKSDRKTGKERRKAEKTLRVAVSGRSEQEMIPSIHSIWCIGRSGHWGNPMLDDLGRLVKPDFCSDCQRNHDKLVKEKAKPAYPTEDEIALMSAMEYQFDMMEIMEQQSRLEEERQIIEKKMHRMYLMNLLLESLEIANKDPYDDYIPEIDDDFDF